MKNATRLGSLVLALAAATQILAQAVPVVTNDFAALDVNKDGRVSSKEAQLRGDLHDVFDSLDVNHDGFLTAAEFSAWGGASKEKGATPVDPTTGPSGSRGAQHMPGN